MDLVDHQNTLVSRQKLLLESGSSYGSIILPLKAPEGYYRFRAYTRYNSNFDPPVIYQAIIPVYSPENQGNTAVNHQDDQKKQPSGRSGITVRPERNVYQPRDSLTVTFEVNSSMVPPGTGNFSISIIPFDLMGDIILDQKPDCPNLHPQPGTLILPERALTIEGELVDPSTGRLISSRLLSVYADQTSQLIRASSREGVIKVAVPDYWGPGTFQILNLDPYNPAIPQIALNSRDLIEDPYVNRDAPPRWASVSEYLDQLIKRRKTIEMYGLYKVPEIENSDVSTKVPDAIYHTSDFRQMFSFEQFINEAIQNVRVREVDGTKTVRLFNRDQGRLFEDHPWYIVDGFLTFDEDKVLQIPFQDIVEIRLFSKTSTLEDNFQGFMLRSGIMEIITRDVKYVRELKSSPNVVEIEGFAKSGKFEDILYISSDRAIPDLRGTIYWSPMVPVDDQGKGRITIPLSDDTGNFAIILMGTDNQRQPISGYQTFEVEMKIK